MDSVPLRLGLGVINKMKRHHRIIVTIAFILFIPRLCAGHNLFPCDYIYKDFENIEASDKIFDNLLESKVDLTSLNKQATLKYAPAFTPEIVYILHKKNQEFFIKRIATNDNIFGLIQVVCKELGIQPNELRNNIKIVGNKINSLTKIVTSDKKISTKLAIHIQEVFNKNISTSRNPTEAEKKELFSYLDGPIFYFKSPSRKCCYGLASMTEPPANKIIKMVLSLEELFGQGNVNTEKIEEKIISETK